VAVGIFGKNKAKSLSQTKTNDIIKPIIRKRKGKKEN